MTDASGLPHSSSLARTGAEMRQESCPVYLKSVPALARIEFLDHDFTQRAQGEDKIFRDDLSLFQPGCWFCILVRITDPVDLTSSALWPTIWEKMHECRTYPEVERLGRFDNLAV